MEAPESNRHRIARSAAEPATEPVVETVELRPGFSAALLSNQFVLWQTAIAATTNSSFARMTRVSGVRVPLSHSAAPFRTAASKPPLCTATSKSIKSQGAVKRSACAVDSIAANGHVTPVLHGNVRKLLRAILLGRSGQKSLPTSSRLCRSPRTAK